MTYTFGIGIFIFIARSRVTLYRTGAAVLPGFLIWEESLGRHRLRFDPPVELIETGDLSHDVRENTKLFNKILESYVRKYPAQWLWIHRRWKTRPEGEPGIY